MCAVVPLDPCSPGWEGQICVARAPAGRDLRVASPSLVLDRGLVAWSLLEISPRECGEKWRGCNARVRLYRHPWSF